MRTLGRIRCRTLKPDLRNDEIPEEEVTTLSGTTQSWSVTEGARMT